MTLDGKTEFWTGDVHSKGLIEQEKQLNKLGDDGWQLVYYHHSGHSAKCHIILKREKE